MVHVDRTGHRGRGAGAGDLHADGRFRTRLQRLRRQGKTGIRGRLMSDKSFLQWPFFAPEHRDWAARVEEVAAGLEIDHADTDAACRFLVRALGEAGLLQATASEEGALDVRKLCLARETLARHDGLADFSFAMQGLGTGAISLFGTAEQKARWLPLTRAGEAISAF